MADQSRNDLELGSNGVPRHALSVGEAAEVKRDAPLRRRRRHRRNCCICCGITFALVVVVIVVIVILLFTVFKQKQPQIHVNGISLEGFNLKFGIPPSLNVTLGVDVTVKNPNHAGFKYTNSTAYMYYHGEQVGEAAIPPGEIGAQGTENIITSVTILAFNLVSNSFLLSDIITGVLPFSVSTYMSGRVNVLNIFKHHVDVSSLCNVSISISNQSIQQTDCDSHVNL